MKKQCSIRINSIILEKIKQEAKRQDRNVSDLINRMLEIQVEYFPHAAYTFNKK